MSNKMTLSSPKRTGAGFLMSLEPPSVTPAIEWDTAGTWSITEEWYAWAESQRAALLKTLVNHPEWFSKPPRQEVLTSIFSPLALLCMQGKIQLLCEPPAVPDDPGSSGVAQWSLDGIMMTATNITPIWKIHTYTKNQPDIISLFNDALTIEGSSSEEEMPPPASKKGSTIAATQEWSMRKFLAKERVREARLKAQIAEKIAAKEESRFYRMYGVIDDGESRISRRSSDYDLSDVESASDM